VVNSFLQPALLIFPAGIEKQVHRPARQLVLGVVLAILVATPGIVKVREVEAVDTFVLDQLEQFRQVVGVVLRHREADADLQAEITAQTYAFQRSFESAVHAAELVVRFADAIERDADVIEITLGNLIDIVFIDQGAVGRQPDVKTLGLGALGDVVNIRRNNGSPPERMSTGTLNSLRSSITP
jgi:hypothetical protein